MIRGAELIGATRDVNFPMPDGLWPGHAAPSSPRSRSPAERKATSLVGKPEGVMYAAALDRLGGGRTLGVGDRLDVDVAGARRAGLDSALVLTGATTREQADAAQPRPTFVAASLGELVLG